MLIDDYEENTDTTTHDGSKREVFNDHFEFNEWQLTPAYPSPYKEYIGKDAPLSNITKKEHLSYIEINLRSAVYLRGIHHKEAVGFRLITDKNEEGYVIKGFELSEAMSFLTDDEKLISVQKVYEYNHTFKKSCHNKLSRAYTRMSLSRGIAGQAAKDLITVRQEQHKTLKEDTERRNWLGIKKPASQWSQMEYRK